MTYIYSKKKKNDYSCSPTWNQMALTILLSTNRGRTQSALNTDVRMNSNQDHTFPCRDGSPERPHTHTNTPCLLLR